MKGNIMTQYGKSPACEITLDDVEQIKPEQVDTCELGYVYDHYVLMYGKPMADEIFKQFLDMKG